MIQRIQSVYLLIVTILLIVCMCNPIGFIIGADNGISEFGNLCFTLPDGSKDFTPWALFGLLFVAAVLSFMTIFMFKKRMIQIRLSIFNSVLLIGYYIVCAILIFTALADETNFSASWGICLPLIALVLNWLAIRAIGKDEVLVKAYERLR